MSRETTKTGSSFAPLASLPGAALVGVGSVLFGKSVVETRGLAWSMAAHALINVGTFSAFYVAVRPSVPAPPP